MGANSYRSCHVNDSFDQLRFLHLRHCGVTPLEFVARKSIPGFQRSNAGWQVFDEDRSVHKASSEQQLATISILLGK